MEQVIAAAGGFIMVPATLNNPIFLSDRVDELSAAFDRVQKDGERIIIERNGGPALALVPLADLEWLEAEEDRRDEEAAREALERLANGEETYSWDEVKAELDRAKNGQ